ncbi:hypothetical protein SAMN05421783_12230 [Thiocapsa roseopersicina]|uniref:Uncharacterized protein n=1 Tax=Thiocapsa roseopersicina TaxID=1058 RepID=A0A1H3B0H4_THIRO|nr:hypothetical protein SAMN05421783_12230 [Thiocapsa roseopersicina]
MIGSDEIEAAARLAHQTSHRNLSRQRLVTSAPRCHACPAALRATCHCCRNEERGDGATAANPASESAVAVCLEASLEPLFGDEPTHLKSSRPMEAENRVCRTGDKSKSRPTARRLGESDRSGRTADAGAHAADRLVTIQNGPLMHDSEWLKTIVKSTLGRSRASSTDQIRGCLGPMRSEMKPKGTPSGSLGRADRRSPGACRPRLALQGLFALRKSSF